MNDVLILFVFLRGPLVNSNFIGVATGGLPLVYQNFYPHCCHRAHGMGFTKTFLEKTSTMDTGAMPCVVFRVVVLA